MCYARIFSNALENGIREVSPSATGAIELSIFSEYYQIELDVVDVQSQRIDRFGECQSVVHAHGLLTLICTDVCQEPC